MAIIKFINNNVSLKTTLNYVMKNEKTNKNLISGKDCDVNNAYLDMRYFKKKYNKLDKGRDKIHFIQSFSPSDNITPEQANEIGMRVAEQFENFQVIVATHTDKEHLHNHIVLNSISFKDGKKFQQSKQDLLKLKKISNEICKEYGLTITDKKAKVDDIKINEYKIRQKGESWKYKLEKDIDVCMKKANNKFDFFKEMKSMGYKVTWTKERKNITFMTPDGKKCRDRKLHNEKYLKENMEKYFKEKTIIQKSKIKYFENEKKYYSNSITKSLIILFKEKREEYMESLYSSKKEYGTNAKKEYARKMSYSSEELEM